LTDLFLGPDEGLGFVVVRVDVGIDVFLKLLEAWVPLSDCPCKIENHISTWLSQDALVGVK
jgi:hypothetical protein